MRHVGRVGARRTDGGAVRADRPDFQQSFVDRRHFRAVGRPCGTAAAARIDANGRVRHLPEGRALAVGGDDIDLVGALTEAFGIKFGERNGDIFAVRRPAGFARLGQRCLEPCDLATGHVDREQARHAPAPVHVDRGDALAIGGPCRAERLGGHVGKLPVLAGIEIANPQLGQAAALIGGVGQLAAIGRPAWVGLHRVVFREVFRRAACCRGNVKVAQRYEGNCLAVGRNGGFQDAERLARSHAVPVALGAGICGARHFQMGGEGDGFGLRTNTHTAALADQAIRRVGIAAALPPGQAEGKDIFVAGHRHAIDFQMAALGVGDDIGELAGGAKGRRVGTAGHFFQQRFGAVGKAGRPDRVFIVAGGGIGDGLAVRRPCGQAVLIAVGRDLAERAADKVDGPDIIAGCALGRAVGREGERLAIGRPCRFAIVICAGRDGARIGAVRLHRPQVIIAVAIGEIGELFAIGGPDRLARVVEIIGDAPGRAALCRDQPEAALHIDRERAAIGRKRHRHGRPFMHIDADDGRAARRGERGGVQSGKLGLRVGGRNQYSHERRAIKQCFHSISPARPSLMI